MTTGEVALQAGNRFANRFEIKSLLAEGGRGLTYAATDTDTGGMVALTHVTAMLSPKQRIALHEVTPRLVALDHPNVNRTIACGVLNERPWFARQLLSGVSLERALPAHKTLPMRRAAAIASQVAKALAAAHAHGIYHRSLKLSNLLLVDGPAGAPDNVVILDLGFAAVLCSDGGTIATPPLSAPEEYIATPVDGRSDVYSLGAVLFQLLTGVSPFPDRTVQDLYAGQVDRAPPRLRAIKTSAAPLEAIVNRMIARRPNDRFSNLLEVAAALDEVLAAPSVELVVDQSDPAPESPVARDGDSPKTWQLTDANAARTLAGGAPLAKPQPLATVQLLTEPVSALPVATRAKGGAASQREQRAPPSGTGERPPNVQRSGLALLIGVMVLATALGIAIGLLWAGR